jgi:hypothetical protein
MPQTAKKSMKEQSDNERRLGFGARIISGSWVKIGTSQVLNLECHCMVLGWVDDRKPLEHF